MGRSLASGFATTCLLLAATACESDPVSGGPGLPDRGPAVAVLEVLCLDDSDRILEPVVAAHRDGVHILVVNRSAYPREVFGRELRPGSRVEFVYPLAPDDQTVSCLPPDYQESALPAGFGHRVSVVDPKRFWIEPRMDCAPPPPDAPYAGAFRFFAVNAPPKVFDGTPETVMESMLTGLEPGDRVVRTGYPVLVATELSVSLMVVRGDRSLGLLYLEPAGPDRWTFGGGEACEDTTFEVRQG